MAARRYRPLAIYSSALGCVLFLGNAAIGLVAFAHVERGQVTSRSPTTLPTLSFSNSMRIGGAPIRLCRRYTAFHGPSHPDPPSVAVQYSVPSQ